MERAGRNPGWRAFPGVTFLCLILAMTIAACDSGGDDGGESSQFNAAADNAAHVAAANVEIMASIYAQAAAGKNGESLGKDDYQFVCSDSGGGSASGVFNFDGTNATWSFNVFLNNCNGVNGSFYMEGNNVPGQTLAIQNFLSGRQTYNGCAIDFGSFEIYMDGITLSNPPTASNLYWSGYVTLDCESTENFIQCEFDDDIANTTSQARAAVAERCDVFSYQEG